MAKSNSKFEVNEDFLSLPESKQDAAVKAFMSANPKAMITPKGDVPPYLRRQVGKRYEICTLLNGNAREFVKSAHELGGGTRDLAAALAGGYTPSSKFYGQPFIDLSAS